MRRYTAMISVLVFCSCAAGFGSTADTRPVVSKDLAPVDVKFTQLLNAELGKGYIGKRVRTVAGFSIMQGTMMGKDEQYRQGWLGAMMFAATTRDDGIECDSTKIAMIGLDVLAPTKVGSVWADAKYGTVYDVVGVVYSATETSGITGSSAAGLILEVESLKEVGRCPEGPGLGGAK